MIGTLRLFSIIAFGLVLLICIYLIHKKPSSVFTELLNQTTYWNYSMEKITQLDCPKNPNWIYDMHEWTNAKGPRSQGAQDLYLEKIFSMIRSTNKYFVEFGFNEPSYNKGGSGANTWKLYDEGWRGLLLDGDRENLDINLKKHYLFANNIVSIFIDNKVPKDFDYLSCDMDSHDLWVFRAILQAGYRPRVITTEYNANYLITDALTLVDPTIIGDGSIPANFSFNFRGCAWGAGSAVLRMVAEAHGYTMVGRVSALDLIWMRNDLLANRCFNIPPFEWFFRDAPIGKLHHYSQKSPDVLSQIIDYETYTHTGGNIDASNKAARDIFKKRNLPCFDNIKNFL